MWERRDPADATPGDDWDVDEDDGKSPTRSIFLGDEHESK